MPHYLSHAFTIKRITACRWFQNVILANRACGGGIAAWKGTNLTDAPGNRYGAYIADSRIIRVSIEMVPCFRTRALTYSEVTRCQCDDGYTTTMLSWYENLGSVVRSFDLQL